jgi:hypothetical protein
MSQPMNICFYSNKCKWSKQFITELAQTPYKSSFRFVCVDPSSANGGRPQLPGWLKKVPTLVIENENEPRTDNDVMNWLYEQRLKERPQGGVQAQAVAAEQDSGPQFYNPLEMASGADSYSFFNMDENSGRVEGDGGSMISQAFEFIGGVAPGQERATMAAPKVQKSRKEQAFDSSMERYMAQRNQGMPQEVKRM